MLINSLDQIVPKDLGLVGGKGISLARLHQNGFNVPAAVCITTNAYQQFIRATGLATRIQMEINRKDFKDMRWEEIWDAALRIRNLFLRAPFPEKLDAVLRGRLAPLFQDQAVAVRSTAPGEDDQGASFAGLHDSYVNVRGIDAIMDHVRLVWASLWSDAALLYRQEIGLSVIRSKMAVVVQEMIDGDRSGVIFTRNPANDRQSVIESVHGLNQGLVDGIVAPDRWILDLATGKILSHTPADRKKWMVAAAAGAVVRDLPPDKSNVPPLTQDQVGLVFRTAMAAEDLFGYPQDMEWTFKDGNLFVLQSRPITAGTDDRPGGDPKKDNRRWYLSLRPSLENLKTLRHRIEQELVVRMIADADALERMDMAHLTDGELADEIERRTKVFQDWKKIYWDDFIPFAHGMRLFGQVYNDTMRPDDPFEFVSLLETSELKSIERNRRLGELADRVRQDPALKRRLAARNLSDNDRDFAEQAIRFFREHMDASWPQDKAGDMPDMLAAILMKLAETEPQTGKKEKISRKSLEERFLSRFEPETREEMRALLDLGRASFQLRDDDNMFLGRIEREMHRAALLGKERLGLDVRLGDGSTHVDEIAKTLRDPEYQPDFAEKQSESAFLFDLRARQLIGQPAGKGIGTGPARIIYNQADLGRFSHGDVMVCDAIEPNMTLVVPMAAAIVERRGGMLIHGAIIAREYGIPCVTGVPGATKAIHDGDIVTVDGFLGIVTLAKARDAEA